MPEWVAIIQREPNFVLNADEILSSGGHPLEIVQAAAAGLNHTSGGVLEASFNPAPLVRVLEETGYEVWPDISPSGATSVYIWRETIKADNHGIEDRKSSFWLEEGVMHMDVRGLQPPEPMIEILKFVDGAAFDGVLMTHTPHYPVHLIPELEARNISADIISDSEDETILRLTGDS